MGNLSYVTAPKRLHPTRVDHDLLSFNQRRFGNVFQITSPDHKNNSLAPSSLGWEFRLPELPDPLWVFWMDEHSTGVEGKHPRPGMPWAYWAWDEFHNALALAWDGINSDEGIEETWPGLPPRTLEAYTRAFHDWLPEARLQWYLEHMYDECPHSLMPFARGENPSSVGESKKY